MREKCELRWPGALLRRVYADSFLRPLARRRASTSRPPFVAIR